MIDILRGMRIQIGTSFATAATEVSNKRHGGRSSGKMGDTPTWQFSWEKYGKG